MKKWFIPLLIFAMLTEPAAVSAEENNEGTVIVVDDWGAEQSAVSDTYDVDPFIPMTMDKAVFDYDDRITVYEPSVYPFSAIALLEVTAECGDTWTASGFMVGPDRLLTGAHCLVCPKHSSWARYINFYFGFKGYGNYRYCYSGRWTAWAGNLFSDRQYTTLNDYGCVKFYENVGDIVGWFGSHWDMSDSSVESERLYVAGYRDGILRYDSGWVRAQDKDHLAYTIDAVAGNSGGPIYTSDYYAVGIHISENSTSNGGYRLTSTVKNYLDGLY